MVAADGAGAGERMMRAGRIAYTNDLPIYHAFDAGAVEFPGTLHSDVPAKLNALMLAGELDISPISAFTYAQHSEEFVLLPNLCIAAHGDVISVVLVSDVPLGLLDGRTVAVTRESASGRNLLRVLLERRYGVHANFVESAAPLESYLESKTPALLIGDAAIDAQMFVDPAYVYDLGRPWTEWTNEDMVFAVWVARRDVFASRRGEIDAALQALVASYRWSLEHKPEVVAAAQQLIPRPPHFYERYYEALKFDFDVKARAGFARYCEELHAIGAIDRVPWIDPEVSRVPR